MAPRRSSRPTTIAATHQSAHNAAVRSRKRADRQAGRARNRASAGATLQPSLVQPTQSAQPAGLLPEAQAVTGGKRRRGDDASQAESRKRKQLESPSGNNAATRLRRSNQITRAERDQSSPEGALALGQDNLLPANFVPDVNSTAAEVTPNATEGHKFLNALYAVASRNC